MQPRRGIEELKKRDNKFQGIRIKGGGRKKIYDQEPKIKKIIEDMIEPHTRGDPESPLRWTSKSVRNITDFLQEKGYVVSHKTVASILHDLDNCNQNKKRTDCASKIA